MAPWKARSISGGFEPSWKPFVSDYGETVWKHYQRQAEESEIFLTYFANYLWSFQKKIQNK